MGFSRHVCFFFLFEKMTKITPQEIKKSRVQVKGLTFFGYYIFAITMSSPNGKTTNDADMVQNTICQMEAMCPYQATAPVLPSYPITECCNDPSTLGIGVNQGILDYTFSSMLNVPFCGTQLPSSYNTQALGLALPYDCEKCPCAVANHSCGYPNSRVNTSGCDYGFGRDPYSFQSPTGGNRSGSIRWG